MSTPAATTRGTAGAQSSKGYVLVAPDSFKGTMDAPTVAAALSLGVADAGSVPFELPLADGGEGTARAVQSALGGDFISVTATGPLGAPVKAEYLSINGGRTAVIDTAAASGLALVPPELRDAEAATSRGTGELLVHAAGAGARHIFLGVGGSACSDGGLGALEAIESGGGLRDVRLTLLCDVTTSYERAAQVFAAQKGADAAAIGRLTDRLHAQAVRLRRDPRGVARSGAAGGLSGALWAECGGELIQGGEAILELLGFDHLLQQASFVITGEGCLDPSTLEGKLVSNVLARAAAKDLPVVAVVGRSRLPAAEWRRAGLANVLQAGDVDALYRAGWIVARCYAE